MQIPVKKKRAEKHLYDPPSTFHTSSSVPPPVVTRDAELPFDKLTWTNFEKLCLRLVKLEPNVEHCQLYGVPGDEQKGIDIYARRINGTFGVYQCKRVKNFGRAKIVAAVDKFLADEWADKATDFTLCMQESLDLADRTDAFEEQHARLHAVGKKLWKWDSVTLNHKLRDQPTIIDDYFGRAWVAEICGSDVANSLGSRLDASQVAQFRVRLAKFYRHVFYRHDYGLAGLPTPPEAQALPIELRYVVPDVDEFRMSPTDPTLLEPDERKPLSVDELDSNIVVSNITRQEGRRVPRRSHSSRPLPHRQSIDSWLVDGQRSVVLGVPGSGKSALLRFIAIDLLQETPQLPSVASKWGAYLPVWVPFAWWTKMISEPTTTGCSLTEMLLEWLRSYGEQEDLCKLVEQALHDERLLLLVDGLDEWTDESSARIALERLQVFIDQHDVPAIVTSRVHGFQRLGMQATGWQVGQLSEFTSEQQAKLSHIWFAHWLRAQFSGIAYTEDEVERKATFETEGFMSKIARSADLRGLAKVPLLLSLLLAHARQNAELPSNRFEAYESIIEHLLGTHPQQRQTASAFYSNSVWPSYLKVRDIRDILARLAYGIQERFASGIIDQDNAERIVEDYLRDPDVGFGFNKPQAKVDSRQLLTIGEDTVGILVRPANSQLRFFHRSIQEYLTAIHLASRPRDEQLQIIREYCIDPHWREVILGVFYRAERGEDIKGFVDVIRSRQLNKHEQYEVDSLLAEVAFGSPRCPANLAQELAEAAYDKVETESWMPFRAEILKHVLSGTRAAKLNESVRSKLQTWFPARTWLRYDTYNAMTRWPLTPDLVECLWRAMHDEEEANRRAAAKTLAQLTVADADISKRVATYAFTAIDPDVRAVALEALYSAWPNHTSIDTVLNAARTSNHPLLRLVAIIGRIKRNTQTDDDKRELLSFVRGSIDISYTWHGDLVQALITGWPQDPDTKVACLEHIRPKQEEKHRRLDQDKQLALFVLVAGYPQDPDVTSFLISELRNAEPSPFGPFPGVIEIDGTYRGAWYYVAANFRDNPALIEAIDEWLPTVKDEPADVAHAARIGRTQSSKAKLLASIGNRRPEWPVHILLEEWGMGDPEVAEVLTPLAYGDSGTASELSPFLKQIIPDQDECRRRLLEILRDPDCKHPDDVVSALHALISPDASTADSDIEIVDAALSCDLDESRDYAADLKWRLIVYYPLDQRVHRLAQEELKRKTLVTGAIARAYASDSWFSTRIISISCPLPAPLREVIATYLSEASVEDIWAKNLLKLYTFERDADTRTQASLGYHTLLKASGMDDADALDVLNRDIVSRGFEREATKQAAFCGLAVLDRLDILLSATEKWGAKEEPAAVSIGDGPSDANVTFLSYVLRNWEMLKAALGGEFWDRLTNHKIMMREPWETLSTLADDYEAPKTELLMLLEEGVEKATTSNVLRFLSRVRPKSPLLLHAIVNAIEHASRASLLSDLSVVAAQLLGQYFTGDEVVRARLGMLGREVDGGSASSDAIVIALCCGWPESAELDEIWRSETRASETTDKTTRSDLARLYLVCRKGSAQMVSEITRRVIYTLNHAPNFIHWVSVSPVIQRIHGDNDLYMNLLEYLRNGEPSASEKSTLPRLLALAHGLSVDVRDWCVSELNKQSSLEVSPEIGFDWLAGKRRPVAHALLDILRPPDETLGGAYGE